MEKTDNKKIKSGGVGRKWTIYSTLFFVVFLALDELCIVLCI